ncbi:hypothetical protein H7849_06120 [Alloacidobacterium dinghuense]|uniref:Uncharacterized protein n=1 Tax=Alloacidobacterium dinghuense TaxID=2763107 RepID=A0A7G8BLV0_9BACT|nr:hypothetical protein [Alloacidobacterium dinghuense]QNI33520.1 hypothetical protein H7849_06120 [Alloacidobacterium dinghuense]
MMNLLIDWTIRNSSLPDQDATCDPADRGACLRTSLSKRRVWSLNFLVLALAAWFGLGTCISSAHAQSTSLPPTMTVGPYTVDANGVKYYPVTSVYQGSQQQIIRVLEPTNPAPGKPRRFLYVLPVGSGVASLSSAPFSDGLEELRLLDVQDRFNLTLIAPSFNYEPWYGDNVLDPTKRMESFIIDNLVPFGDTLAQGAGTPQRYLIGFSKSGNGVLFLILRHPGVFSAAAAWDSPAQLSDLSAFDALPMNFGTQANYNTYNIPALVSSNAQPFQQQNRLWVSGDQAAWTADMIQLNSQLTAAGIPHTWVQGGVRAHSWGSGWLDGAVTDLDANATLSPPTPGLTPARSGGLPAGALPAGITQVTLSLTTDENATCRYATSAGVAYAAMTSTFTTTGETAHATPITGLQDGGSYSYSVRCQDSSGNANPNDYTIAFTVASSSDGTGVSGSTATSTFSGVEDPLSENGMWGASGSWSTLKKNNGAYTTSSTSAARLVLPVVGTDQFSEITYDQDPGNASWIGVMTRMQSPGNGSGYLAIAYAGQVILYRTDDIGYLNFTTLASAATDVSVAPRRLRLESQGNTHRVYFNGALMLTYTDSANTYSTGQPGIADAIFGGPTVHILSFSGGALSGTGTGTPDTTPPVRSAGQPSGTLPSGTTQVTLSLTTDENATCRYATSADVAFSAMTSTFTTTGGTAHATPITGLQDGNSYSYSVRCQDSSGNANPDDYTIAITVASSSDGTGVSGSTATSSFSGVEDPLSENGMWSASGSWSTLKKNNGAYTTSTTSAARLVLPVVSADQFAEITYDQDPGNAAWPAVMTRMQSPTNGSGYLAIAYNGQVTLYRTDDVGYPSFSWLATANTDVSVAPRRLRLESQGNTHRVYFNGALMLTYTDSANTYSTGQPGIAAAIFGGPTVHILSFSGGALSGTGTGTTDTTPPVRSAGQPTGSLPSGTTQVTLSLTTDENATCRYATSAGVAFSAMTSTFTTTGGTAHATPITGLQDGNSYSYSVRCQDSSGNANPDDYSIAFTVASSSDGTGVNGSTATSTFNGVEDPLSENGMWGASGSWSTLKKNNGAYTISTTSAARLLTPVVAADQFAEITYDQDPGNAAWPAVMTRMQGPTNGSGYLAIAYNGQVTLYRTDDVGYPSFNGVASANTDISVAPRRLRLESQGNTHRVYFNGALMLTYTDSANTYSTGQPGIAAAIFGGPTVHILSFSGGALSGNRSGGGTTDTTPPVRTGGQPTGSLPSGTTQVTLSLTTDENATCRYATSAGVAFSAMTSTFTTTGGTAHATPITGLQDGGSYSYSVRCQDSSGNANPDDYSIAFSVANSTSGTGANGSTATSTFNGVEDPLSENGMWGASGSWSTLKKNNGAYTTSTTSAARLLTPVVAADQFAEITYDQDPGNASWPAVMTRMQSATNGSGYLAIAYNGQVTLYRTDDVGYPSFSWLASANVDVSVAPRRLRLESQGNTHRVYFNGALMLTYIDSANTYSTGQPGIAAAIFGGPTVHILSFSGGAL